MPLPPDAVINNDFGLGHVFNFKIKWKISINPTQSFLANLHFSKLSAIFSLSTFLKILH